MTLVLTTDELRVSATIHGGRLPVTVDSGWSTEDIPVADVVALRGLLARGLATSHDTDVRLAGDLAAIIAPLLSTSSIVEARRDGFVRPGRWLVATSTAGVVSAAERQPDLWHLGSGEDLFERLLGHLDDTEPARQGATVPTELLIEAERLPAEHLAVALAERGLRPEVADLVAAVVAGLRATVTVRTLHRNGSATECAAITWLETAAAGVWLAIPSDDEQTEANHTELRPTDRHGLLVELRDLLGGDGE
jgi:hypothetical protein